MLWLLIIGGIVLIIVGACQKEPDGDQAQRISKIGSTMVKVGIAIVIGIIVIYVLIFAGAMSMVRNF
jgi:hypothetical protein